MKGNLACYAPLVLIILLLLGCSPAVTSPIEQGSTDLSPLIRNLSLSIAPNNPLAAVLTFDTDRPTEANVTLSSNEHTVTAPSSDGLTTNHRLHVLGLRAREKYAVTISVVDEGGNVSYDRSMQLKTAPLPDDFPPLKITLSEPGRMQPGVTVFNVRRWNPDRDEKWGMLIGVDEQGEVVWYHHDECMIHFVTQTRNGNLLYLCRRGEAIEVNTMGERVRAWAPAELDPSVDFFHHEILEIPSGNFLVLTRENRQINGYDRDGQQVAYNVVGDVIVEFTSGGVIVNRWSVFDMLDPHRIGPSFHLPRGKGKQLDWTHGNSLFYDESDNSITVSLRHQDWVIKFDRETGELIWRLGAEGDFSLVGDGEWFFQQHAAKLLDDRWLLYDNGKDRPGIEHAYQLYSRVVQYRLDTSSEDPAEWSATQIWEFRDSEPFYSSFLGEADFLDNGNILISDGGRVTNPKLSVQNRNNTKWVRVVEVTGTSPPEKVFELIIRDEIPQPDGIGYSSNRVEKLDSLYPASHGE